MKIFQYDTTRYDFAGIIADFLSAADLSTLESEVENDAEAKGYSLYKNMERSVYYKRLYECLNGERGERFYETYHRFVKEVIQPAFGEPVYYQLKPTHRILFADNPGASRFHRDRDYGHNTAEINYCVPQTKAYDTNTIWIESEEGKNDFQPIEMEIGEYAQFDGASLLHGAKVNKTGRSRVSFDFRVIPQSKAPASFTDTSSWKEEDKDNPLFKNAHNFALCS